MLPSKNEDNPLSLILVTSSLDLLKCKRISQQLKIHNRPSVLLQIGNYLTKCLIGLNILMDKETKVLLCQDIIEKYKEDSLEDVRECFMNGRQGTYTFGHESRHALTMQVFTLWMEQHLTKKASARERQLEALKAKQLESQSSKIDYSAYKERIEKEREDQSKLKKTSRKLKIDLPRLKKISRLQKIKESVILIEKLSAFRRKAWRAKKYWTMKRAQEKKC